MDAEDSADETNATESSDSGACSAGHTGIDQSCSDITECKHEHRQVADNHQLSSSTQSDVTLEDTNSCASSSKPADSDIAVSDLRQKLPVVDYTDSDRDHECSPDNNCPGNADNDLSENVELFPNCVSETFVNMKTSRMKHDNDDGDDDETGKSDHSSIDVMDTSHILKGLHLPDRWHALSEFRHREIGGWNRQHNAVKFSNKTGASIDLVRRLKCYTKLDGHTGCVNALHFNDSGSLLASGSDDLNIVVWKWAESKPFYTFDSGHRSNVFQCKFMPFTGDSHLVSCARDGHVRLAELSSTGACKTTKKLAQHRGAAHKLAMLSDSSHVFYSCGEDGVTYEFDIREDKPNKLCETREGSHRVELYSIHAHPFKSYEICVAGRDPYVRIYDIRKLKEDKDCGALKKFCPQHLLSGEPKANITCAVYNYDGSEVLASYNDEDIYLFDASVPDALSSGYLHKYTGHRNSATVKGVNFYGPKSEFIVSGSDCGHVFLWDQTSECIVNYFHADDGGVVNVLEPHPNIPVLATSGLDHDCKIWVPTAEEPTCLEGLDKVVKKNHAERETDRGEPDFDTHMFWMLMRHLRRSRNRQRRAEENDQDNENEDEFSSDDDTSSGDSGDENDNSDDVPVATVRCNQS